MLSCLIRPNPRIRFCYKTEIFHLPFGLPSTRIQREQFPSQIVRPKSAILILPQHSRLFYMEVPPGSLCTDIPPLIFLRGGGVCIQYRLLRGRGGGAMVRLVNFVPESRLMYKNIKTLPETGINDSFEEMEPEFSFGIFCPEEEDYLSKCIFR